MRVHRYLFCATLIALIAWAIPVRTQVAAVTEVITVSSTAVGLGASTLTEASQSRQATACVFTVVSNDIRLRYDGTNPTASVGHLYSDPAAFQVSGVAELRNLKMIRVTSDATVTVTCSYGPPGPALAAAGGGGGGGGAGGGDASEAKQDEQTALLTTIDGDTGGILTAVQLIDNAISGAGFNITQFGGAAVPIGAGVEATAVRVTLPTDGTGVVGIGGTAGSNLTDMAADIAAMQTDIDNLVNNLIAPDAQHDNAAIGTGPQIMGECDDAATDAVDEGDAGRVRVDCTTRRLLTADLNTTAILTAVQLIDNPVFVDDVPFTPATSSGFAVGGQADDTSTDSVDEGDFGAFRISLDRLLYTRQADPCSGGATKLFLPFDITTATTTEITPSLAGASTHYYICALNIVTTAANNVNLVDDNSDNCASVTASLISSGLAAGDGWGLGANGGIAIGNGAGTIMRTQTSNAVLCLVTSAATELHGQFVVVAAP